MGDEGGEVDSDAQLEQSRRLAKAGPATTWGRRASRATRGSQAVEREMKRGTNDNLQAGR